MAINKFKFKQISCPGVCMSVKIWIELIRSFKIQKIGLQVQVCCREFLILQTAALCLATVRNEELLRPDGHQSRLNAWSEENEWRVAII